MHISIIKLLWGYQNNKLIFQASIIYIIYFPLAEEVPAYLLVPLPGSGYLIAVLFIAKTELILGLQLSIMDRILDRSR